MRRHKYSDIYTDRLILKPSVDERDLDAYLQHIIAADEFFFQYGEEKSDELIEAINFHSTKVIYYTIFGKDSGKMLGYVGVLPHNKMEGDLELYIFQEYRRNNYALEACNALVDECKSGRLTGNKMEYIIASTDMENLACQNLLKKLGFKKTASGMRMGENAEGQFTALCLLCEYTLECRAQEVACGDLCYR